MSETTSKIYVPDHILDMVVERAGNYVVESRERWLGGFSQEERDKIEAFSTHNFVNTPERRELHRSILQEVASHMRCGEQEKPKLLYVAGPMAVGKSTLLKVFDAKIIDEDNKEPISFDSDNLREIYEVYKSVKQRCLTSDFHLYKRRLPEFDEFGGEFAFIRAEASALDNAVMAWSKELKANMVLEQLGDGDISDWAKKQQDDYELIALGVTADPVTNFNRLHERNESDGEVISDEELTRTIRGFSKDEAFDTTVKYTSMSFLVDARNGKYDVIYKGQNGCDVYKNNDAYDKFKSYSADNVSGLSVTSVLDAKSLSPN